ncbi:MAG: hypothetical protein LBJ63_00445 [Prevotellaceae bacterium]|jgi:hypothetical protein|nr:hypothetical protein [Prevotellaceae bacterium]
MKTAIERLELYARRIKNANNIVTRGASAGVTLFRDDIIGSKIELEKGTFEKAVNLLLEAINKKIAELENPTLPHNETNDALAECRKELEIKSQSVNPQELRTKCIDFIVRQTKAAGTCPPFGVVLERAKTIEQYILTGEITNASFIMNKKSDNTRDTLFYIMAAITILANIITWFK